MDVYILFSIIELLWAGMILGISCLEAWVKFKAPTLTRVVALDVGQTVFNAFHKVQCGLASILILCAIFYLHSVTFFVITALLILLLLLQIAWVFPNLRANIASIQKVGHAPKSHSHALYALFELIKLTILLASAIMFLMKLN